MHQMFDNKDPQSNFFIEVTPEQLRIVAARLEQRLSTSFPGQTVTIQFTQNIMLFASVGGVTTVNMQPFGSSATTESIEEDL